MKIITFIIACLLISKSSWAQSAPSTSESPSAAQLAQKLTNPVADLMSFPVQTNLEFGVAPTQQGTKVVTNIQPVIPLSLNKELLLINRLILPIAGQTAAASFENKGKFGLGDTLYTAFLSLRKPFFNRLIVGVGPVINLPTSTKQELGVGLWGVGPSVVAIGLFGKLLTGALVNYLPFFGSAPGIDPEQLLFIQPFTSYTFATATSLTLQAEASYLAGPNAWSIPINFMVAQVVPIAKIPFSFGAGPRYYAKTFDNGPTWGARFVVTMILPK